MTDHTAATAPATAPPATTPARRAAVSDAAFRQAMAAVATPVSVVTTTERGTPYGTTVNAFASLSAEPPMVLIALGRTSTLLSVLCRTRRFALNVLAAEQADLAAAFARRSPDRFAGVRWREDDGLPRLDGAGVWLACTVEDFLPGGDHLIAAGAVTACGVREEAAPLTYHRHRFGTHAAA